MTVIIRPSGGRWASVDYVGGSTQTLSAAVELAMVNGGFASWAAGSGEDRLVPAQVRVPPSGGAAIEDPKNPGGALGGAGSVAVAISGSAGVGNVLTAIPAVGWSASSWQWYRDGVAISGAMSKTYTQQDDDVGATITVAGSGWSFASQTGVSVPIPPFPTPSNKLIALFGDSRTQDSSLSGQYSGDVSRLMPGGYATWMLAACGYRVEIVDNYGVAGQDLGFNLQQLTGLPGLGSTVYKGNLLSGGDGSQTNPSPTQAATIIMLAGVNGVLFSRGGAALGGQTPWGDVPGSTAQGSVTGTAAFYNAILSSLTSAGKNVLLANEIPNKDDYGAGAAHMMRRASLDAWPANRRIAKLNTWDQLSATPGANDFKAGYIAAGENVHPNIRGKRALGEYIASVINQMYASFPVRNQLPTGQNDAGYLYSTTTFPGTPTTGTNIVGQIANGFSANRTANAGLTVEASLVVGADGYTDQVFRIYGTGTAAAGTVQTLSFSRVLNLGSAASPLAANGINPTDGDRLFTIARVNVDSGNSGLLGVSPYLLAQCSNPSFTQVAEGMFASTSSGSGTIPGDWGGMSFSGALMSQPVTLPVGWSSTATGRVVNGGQINIYYYGDRAIDITVRIARFGIVRNR